MHEIHPHYGGGPPAGLFMLGLLCLAVVALAFWAFTTLCWCLIFRKAGWSWAMGLLTLVPIANVVMFLMLAFARWPIRRELDALRATRGNPPPA